MHRTVKHAIFKHMRCICRCPERGPPPPIREWQWFVHLHRNRSAQSGFWVKRRKARQKRDRQGLHEQVSGPRQGRRWGMRPDSRFCCIMGTRLKARAAAGCNGSVRCYWLLCRMAPARVAVSVALAGALVVCALALASWSVAGERHRVEVEQIGLPDPHPVDPHPRFTPPTTNPKVPFRAVCFLCCQAFC